MIGDNIYIHVQYKYFVEKNEILRELFSVFRRFLKVENELVKKKVDDNLSFDEISLDFKNDYNVTANFFISYNKKMKSRVKEVSISGYNHPAGEFLFNLGEKFCEEINKNELVEMLVLVDDSEFTSEEIFSKMNNRLEDIGIISIYKK